MANTKVTSLDMRYQATLGEQARCAPNPKLPLGHNNFAFSFDSPWNLLGLAGLNSRSPRPTFFHLDNTPAIDLQSGTLGTMNRYRFG